MAKWMVQLETVIEADERSEAWKSANRLCFNLFDDLVNVKAISLKPLTESESWLALNQSDSPARHLFDKKSPTLEQ